MQLLDRWKRTWELCEAEPPSTLFGELRSAYAEPQRAYHTAEHLVECFEHLDAALRSSAISPSDVAALELAIWFHDAVYEPRAQDNEVRSANFARLALAQVAAVSVERICALILATEHHRAALDGDQELLLDVDLAILGADDARFDRYEAQIRKEFAWAPEEAYRRTRARLLEEFLARPVLFNTEYFRDRFEARARQNLERSIAALLTPS